jgi:hypothetical protein
MQHQVNLPLLRLLPHDLRDVRASWKITAFVSRALNFIAFSCPMGSLSAMTPRLPKPNHRENRLKDSTLLVAAGAGARR